MLKKYKFLDDKKVFDFKFRQMKTKNIIDFYSLFGIQIGKEYHSLDTALQICMKSFKIYSNEKDNELKEDIWRLTKLISRHLHSPIPIQKPEPETE